MKPGSFQLEVECYAGYRADERPLRFRLKASQSATHTVTEIADCWLGPSDRSFKVLAEDGNFYILRHDERNDQWTLEAFARKAAS